MKKRERGLYALLAGMALLTLGCLAAYPCALWRDWQAGDMEAFELAARLLGYVLSLSCVALCAGATLRFLKKGDPVDHRAMTAVTLATVVLLTAHDVLLYATYGNMLEGTLTMTAFFVLDIGLLVVSLAAVALAYWKRAQAMPKAVALFAAVLWAVYIAGDMAGYPASSLADWDEALMKACFVFPPLLALLAPPTSSRSDTTPSSPPSCTAPCIPPDRR